VAIQLSTRFPSPNVALALLALPLLAFGIFFFRLVEVSFPPFYQLLFLFAVALPFPVAFISDRFSGWKGTAIRLSCLVLIPPSFIFLLAGLLDFAIQTKTERLGELVVDGERIVIYRTDNLLPPPYGIAIKQECIVVSGIKAVRIVSSEYPAASVKIEELPNGFLQFTYPAYSERRDEDTVATSRLRRGCWGGVLSNLRWSGRAHFYGYE